MQTHLGRNVRIQWVLQLCGMQLCDSTPGHRTTLLPPPPAGLPTNEVFLFCKYAVMQFERLRDNLLHARSVVLHSGVSLVFTSQTALLTEQRRQGSRERQRSRDREAESREDKEAETETHQKTVSARMCSRKLIAYKHGDSKNAVLCNSGDQTHNARMCSWRKGECV